MERNEVKKIITEALGHIQEISGRAVPDLQNENCLIRDLEDFDSVNCVEFTCEVSASIGFEVDAKRFIPNALRRPMTLGEAIDRLWNLSKVQQKETRDG